MAGLLLSFEIVSTTTGDLSPMARTADFVSLRFDVQLLPSARELWTGQ